MATPSYRDHVGAKSYGLGEDSVDGRAVHHPDVGIGPPACEHPSCVSHRVVRSPIEHRQKEGALMRPAHPPRGDGAHP
jgi:hypothetical protein